MGGTILYTFPRISFRVMLAAILSWLCEVLSSGRIDGKSKPLKEL